MRERSLSSGGSRLITVVDDYLRYFPAGTKRALRVLAETRPARFDTPMMAAMLACDDDQAEELRDELHYALIENLSTSQLWLDERISAVQLVAIGRVPRPHAVRPSRGESIACPAAQ